MPKSKQPMWLYIARCRDGSFYTGIAMDVKARLDRHNSGHGAKYTSTRRPIMLVYSEVCASRSEALKLEYQIKSWPRARKVALVKAGRRSSAKSAVVHRKRVSNKS